MSRLFVIIFIIFITSCNDIEFVYKENKNLINPLYEKTNFSTSGNDINFINSYLPMFFGDNKEDIFELSINIEEKKTKRSVESNQAASMIRYDLKFVYTLISKKKNCPVIKSHNKLFIRPYYTYQPEKKNCVTFEKELLSYFSILPKSSGYNYGTDASLEKKYELAIIDNLNRFTSMLSDVDIKSCK